ncbi:MAG TPA: zf-HC2 domain-containing protein, partial [Thermoleophilaceae bacterium]|nr:zf-HC2 domain-containing protein [Thermoleophilaceae bacterium]
MLATARRHAANADDAEDAYQRGLEILLTRAPTAREEDLVGWLKTVVKHEAWALARQRERHTPVAEDPVLERAAGSADAAGEHAERLERLRLCAEALGRLKPQEVRALLLRADGHSYRQIQEITGWTYTKVNRCLTEGRASFAARVRGIESGAECERLASKLSALADGEAGATDLAALRPHLRSCLACRARLREYRAAPARVAAVAPAGLVLVAGPRSGGTGSSLVEGAASWAGERAGLLAMKVQGAAEVVSAQKLAAVAASGAVLAGGGAAAVREIEARDRAERRAERVERRSEEPRRRARRTPTPVPAALPAPAPAARPRVTG